MTSQSNRLRRARGAVVIERYLRLTAYAAVASDEALIDVLTDLMHWAGAARVDFDVALEQALFHYDTEVAP